MSHPPKYVSSLGDEEEAVGLLGADQVDATYPPTAAANAVSNGGLDETRSVVYHLRTDWPLKDEIPHQQSMSIIGKSRDETVQLVLEAFPDLQKIDEDRLEFYVPSDPIGPAQNDISHYARISGPAWARLDQVAVVRIGIRASADELECRRKQQRRSNLLLASLLFSTWVVGPVLVFLAIRLG